MISSTRVHCNAKTDIGTRKHSVLTIQGIEYPGQDLPAPLRSLNLKCLRSSVSMQVPLVPSPSSMWRQPGRGLKLLLNLRYRSFSETRTTSRELLGFLRLRPYCCGSRLPSGCQNLHGPLWRSRIRPGKSRMLYGVSTFPLTHRRRIRLRLSLRLWSPLSPDPHSISLTAPPNG